MSRNRLVPGVATIVLLLCVLGVNTSAQKKQTQSANEKPRKVRTESDRALKDWPKEVGPIITEAERAAFQKLQTNDEREHFIDDFWDRRDPDPDTQENEYKDEYYERLAYANEHFASGKPGWLTDRGRIYLKWGKPDEIESHPAGGQYQRTFYEGTGATTTFPFEKWFYRYLPGVGSGVEVEFVDPSGSGEYRIARSPSEKEVKGLGGNEDGVRSGRDFADTQNSPFKIIELLKDLEAPPPVNFRGPKDVTIGKGPVIEDNVLGFEVKPNFFNLANGRVIVAFTIQTDNRELVFRDSGGLQTARLNIFGKVLTINRGKVGAFEDVVETTATVGELAEAKERKSVYGKAVILPPGRYRLDVTLRDVASGARGFRQLGFVVPRFDSSKLTTSSIVLTARLENLKDGLSAGPFMIGKTKVIPNISGVYHRGEPVGIYLQVYNTGIDQTTLRPSVDVEYALLKDGKELRTQTEDWRGMGNTTDRLILARLLDTQTLVNGEYEVQVRLHDRVTGQELAPSAKFTVK